MGRAEEGRGRMHKKMLAACCAVIAALLLLLPLPVGAAAAGDVGEAYAAAVYDNASGMPFSEANLTIQTPDGFLYIGSYGGLTRFDGRRFEAVEGVSSAVSLFTDSRGRLWVGTSEMGAVCLDGGSLTVYGPEEGLNSSVRGFCEEESGDILMATRSGLFLLDGNGQISQLPDERFRGKYILSIAGDGAGNVYGIGTGKSCSGGRWRRPASILRSSTRILRAADMSISGPRARNCITAACFSPPPRWSASSWAA